MNVLRDSYLVVAKHLLKQIILHWRSLVTLSSFFSRSTKIATVFACMALISTAALAQSGSKRSSGSSYSRNTTSNQSSQRGSSSKQSSTTSNKSSSKGSSSKQSTSNDGSSSKQAMSKKVETKLGYAGYCPVCILDMKKWVKGSAEHQVTYDSTVYHFPSAETKEKFMANPVKYVPALGGDCTVCLAKVGKRVAGDVRFASLHENRVYLFPEEKQKKMFDESPAEYANVDLAANGNCIVCTVKMNKEVPGSTEFTAIYKGMRYLFPADEQRQMFIKSPTDFVKMEK